MKENILIALIAFLIGYAWHTSSVRASDIAHIYAVQVPDVYDSTHYLKQAQAGIGGPRVPDGDVKGFACDTKGCYVVIQ
jgi:hypothetical protein